jgi:diguanylate cyclase (GGDEF)-like protein/PAS domain S-box-containing protein
MITQKQKYGTVIGLGLTLLLIAGLGAYEAITSLLNTITSHPADEFLTASVTRIAAMVGVCFVAALIIALASIIFMRREFERRRRTEERLDRVLKTAEQAGDLITILEKRGRIEYSNKAVELITGYTQKELLGKRNKPLFPWYTDETVAQKMRDSVLSGDSFRAVLACRTKNGEQFVIQEHVTPLKDSRGNITRMLSTAREITRQKQLEERLDYLDNYDPLTGVSNRKSFARQLRQALRANQNGEQLLSVMIMDIDRFKYINDLFGSQVGDEVLQRISETLRGTVGKGDIVARLGSDEFGVIHRYRPHLIDTVSIAEHIRRAVAQKVMIGGQDIVMTVTIGIAIFPDNGKDAKTLLKNADIALSRAKSQGRNTIQFYSTDIIERISDFYFMEKRLFSALKNDEYLINYQPYCDLSTKKIAGAEALIRWKSGDLDMVAPTKFIPTLEDTGMIIDVGEWVLRSACRQIKEWMRINRNLSVAVNLSLLQFHHRNFIAMVSEAIKDMGIDPGNLTLELTESICIQDMDLTITILKKLKNVGVMISVDDFGTGYSSLNYIKKLPVDNLKIDMSFVRDVTRDPDAASIITAITSMARSLNLKTIAEGVETEEQRNILHLLRCDMGQGFYFSPAVPAAEFKKLME